MWCETAGVAVKMQSYSVCLSRSIPKRVRSQQTKVDRRTCTACRCRQLIISPGKMVINGGCAVEMSWRWMLGSFQERWLHHWLLPRSVSVHPQCNLNQPNCCAVAASSTFILRSWPYSFISRSGNDLSVLWLLFESLSTRISPFPFPIWNREDIRWQGDNV